MTATVNYGHAPGSLPVLGHIHRLARDPLAFLMSLPDYGNLVRVRLGTLSVIVVCDAALTRTVLLDDRTYDKGGLVFDRLREALGNGLATCPHADHRRQRRLTQPAFRRERMPHYADAMLGQYSELIGSWRGGEIIDVSEEMMRLTARVVVATLFDDRVSHSMIEEMSDDVAGVTHGVIPRMLSPSGWEWLVPSNRRFLRARAHLRSVLKDLISTYRAAGVDHGDLMSMLLTSHGEDGLSDSEVTDQAATFFLAGIETAASLLTSTLHVLAHHPEIQHRLWEEAHSALSAAPLSYQRVGELPYTARVLAETLRLYPPAWMFTRRVTADTELGGHALPAGATVLISPYLLQRRADLVADPQTFNPDREVGGIGTPGGAFIAFGAGPRKCIGETFARVETVLLLATLVARWRVLPIASARYRAAARLTLAPRRLRVRVVARSSTDATPPTAIGTTSTAEGTQGGLGEC